MNAFCRLFIFLGCNLVQFHLGAMIDKEAFIQDVTNRTILDVEYAGRIFKVTMKGVGQDPSFSLHLYRHNSIGICYFAPLIKTFKKVPIEKIAYQYLLFDAAAWGNKSQFTKAMNNGADINALDRRFNPMLFVFQQENGGFCTIDDVDNGKFNRLAKAPKPFLGANTYDWSVVQHVMHQGRVHMIKEIRTHALPLLSKEEQEAYSPNELDEGLVEYDRQNIKLLKAQKKAKIPTFILEKTCDLFKDISHEKYDEHYITSEVDDNLKMRALITKESVKVGCVTPIDTWKQQALDLDALATLYAAVICYNDKDGKRIAHLFEHWKKVPAFRTKVVHYLRGCLESQTCSERKLVPENIVLFADKALKDIPDRDFLHECLIVGLRCFVSKADPNFNRQYHDLLSIMLGHSETKNVLKTLCDAEPELFKQTVKPKMQQAILRNYVARMLHHRNVQETEEMTLKDLPKGVVDHIVSFWQPDEEFKQALKLKVITENQ